MGVSYDLCGEVSLHCRRVIHPNISRNNQRNILLEQPLEFFVCLFVFTGIFVPITFWILTQAYSPTWQIWGACKLSEYLLNNVGLNCLTHYFKSECLLACLLAYFERTRTPLTSFLHSFRFPMVLFSSTMLKPVSLGTALVLIILHRIPLCRPR